MAENESLDLGGSYSKRWKLPWEAVRKREPCADVARKFKVALIGGLRRTFVQTETEYGVSLSDLLANRHSPDTIRSLVKKTHGHQYIRLFTDVAAMSSGSDRECLRSFLDAILDTVWDQVGVSHDVVGTPNCPTANELKHYRQEVLTEMEPELERLSSKLEKDPHWKPKRLSPKGASLNSPTRELLGMSLLNGVEQ